MGNMLLLATTFLMLFGIAEILHHEFRQQPEVTRKIVHTGTGLLTLLFPICLDNIWFVLMLCSSFALLLLLSIRFRLLPSIHKISRPSIGSLAFPVSVFICYWMYESSDKQLIYYFSPILILTLADPLAALVGSKWPIKTYSVGMARKSFMGSGIFLITTILIQLTLFYLFSIELSLARILLEVIVLSILVTLAEALSANGYDNLSIPVTTLIALLLSEKIIN